MGRCICRGLKGLANGLGDVPDELVRAEVVPWISRHEPVHEKPWALRRGTVLSSRVALAQEPGPTLGHDLGSQRGASLPRRQAGLLAGPGTEAHDRKAGLAPL